MKKKVRYIDPFISEYFSQGHVYEVEKETEDSYYIKIENHSLEPFIKSRFEEVPEPPKKRVKYTDPIGTSWLERDIAYEVEKEDKLYYWINTKNHSLQPFNKSRFEVVCDPSMEIEYYEVIRRPPLSVRKVGEPIRDKELFDECGAFPDYFKPVYKEQFKAGDWIAVDDPNWKYGAVQLTEVTENGFRSREHGYWGRESDYGEKTRLATPEEIRSATSVSIGGYEMGVLHGDKAVFASYTFTKGEIRAIRLLVSSCIKAEITIRGEKLTVQKLDKILNKLK